MESVKINAVERTEKQGKNGAYTAYKVKYILHTSDGVKALLYAIMGYKYRATKQGFYITLPAGRR